LAGIEPERLQLEWVSSAEAQRFVAVATATTSTVAKLGALDIDSLSMNLEAAEMTVNGEPIRWLVGKSVKLTTRGDVYGRKWDVEEYETILYHELEREYQKNLIYLAFRDGCKSVREVSEKIGVELLRVSYLLADLEKTNRVEFSGMEESKPVFVAL